VTRALVAFVFVLGGCLGSTSNPSSNSDAGGSAGGSSGGGGGSTAGGGGSAGGSDAGGGGSTAGGGGGGTTVSDGGTSGSGADMSAPPGTPFVYVGGYAGTISVYALDPQTGKLTAKTATTYGSGPSFLAIDPSHQHLYAVDEDNSKVAAFTIDQKAGTLTHIGTDVGSGGSGPAFLSVDRSGKYVLVPNYTNGAVATFPIGSGGTLGAQIGSGAPGQLAHMMITDPANKFVFVPCLMSNYIAEYTFDATTGKIGAKPVTFQSAQPAADGQGPRHIAFAPSGKMVYLINETASTMTAFSYDATSGALTATQTVSTLASGTAAAGMTGAEVWVHPSGKWLYGSNRDGSTTGGKDSIAVFDLDGAGKMTLATTVKSGGVGPRSFTLDPTGQWLLVANQTSGNVVVFKIDQTSGIPAAVGTPTAVPMASFVGVVNLPGA
jgi:6-phosphogluconolactonase